MELAKWHWIFVRGIFDKGNDSVYIFTNESSDTLCLGHSPQTLDCYNLCKPTKQTDSGNRLGTGMKWTILSPKIVISATELNCMFSQSTCRPAVSGSSSSIKELQVTDARIFYPMEQLFMGVGSRATHTSQPGSIHRMKGIALQCHLFYKCLILASQVCSYACYTFSIIFLNKYVVMQRSKIFFS